MAFAPNSAGFIPAKTHVLLNQRIELPTLTFFNVRHPSSLEIGLQFSDSGLSLKIKINSNEQLMDHCDQAS
jgi:hypothetical protein